MKPKLDKEKIKRIIAFKLYKEQYSSQEEMIEDIASKLAISDIFKEKKK